MIIIRTLIAILGISIFLPAHANEKLIFAIDLIRHGDRTPLKEIAIAPYSWKEGLGQLTSVGMKQEYLLGKQLRNKYVYKYRLLPAKYDPQKIYVRSTDINRTIASARMLLLGLYPCNQRPIENKNIPIYTMPTKKDRLLIVRPQLNLISLGRLYLLCKHVWQEKALELEPKLAYWRRQTGMPLRNFEQLGYLADNLRIRLLHQVPLPDGITPNNAREIIVLGEWALTTCFRLRDVAYPMGSYFLMTTENYLNSAAQKRTPLKFVLFSAHDSSIMSVMYALGLPVKRVPKYAADLNFSLFENHNNYYLKVSYNGKPVFVPACHGSICTLAQFHQVVTNFTVGNH